MARAREHPRFAAPLPLSATLVASRAGERLEQQRIEVVTPQREPVESALERLHERHRRRCGVGDVESEGLAGCERAKELAEWAIEAPFHRELSQRRSVRDGVFASGKA